MRYNVLLLLGGLVLIALLSLRALKQFIYLSFTLLSLKVVWFVIILFVALTWIRKQTGLSRKVK